MKKNILCKFVVALLMALQLGVSYAGTLDESSFSPLENYQEIQVKTYDKEMKSSLKTSPIFESLNSKLKSAFPHVESFFADGIEYNLHVGGLSINSDKYSSHIGPFLVKSTNFSSHIGPFLVKSTAKKLSNSL